jgi:hypothetical protein
MTVYTYDSSLDDMKPPVTSTGALGWMKSNLFNGWFNSILTILVVAYFLKPYHPFSSGLSSTAIGCPPEPVAVRAGCLLVRRNSQSSIYHFWVLSPRSAMAATFGHGDPCVAAFLQPKPKPLE